MMMSTLLSKLAVRPDLRHGPCFHSTLLNHNSIVRSCRLTLHVLNPYHVRLTMTSEEKYTTTEFNGHSLLKMAFTVKLTQIIAT